jgi:hypothetical protein
MKQDNIHLHAESGVDGSESLTPKAPYVNALFKLSKRVPDVRALFDRFGHVRTVCTDAGAPLFDEPLSGTFEQQSSKFLAVPEITSALGLRYVSLSNPQAQALSNLGQRVEYKQEIDIAGTKYRVRGGFVHVYMDAAGKVFTCNSTLRYGRRNTDLTNIVSEQDAIANAKAHLRFESYLSERCELVFSQHNGRLDPTYEIVLSQEAPRKVVLVLVRAVSGEVVYTTNLLRVSQVPEVVLEEVRRKTKKRRPRKSSPVAARTFLRIPDPNKPLPPQIYDQVLDSLNDPKVLANNWFTMYVGDKSHPVKAKADGTFNYKPNDPEFSAVVVYWALTLQFQLYQLWGMTMPTKPIPVFVEDHSVTDNAYFDPENYEIHIGIGSGLKSGGLNRYIAYDLGVEWHENGHHVVFLQTPGNDLPGQEGSAIHESTGDTLGDLLMDFWCRLKFGKLLGSTITQADVDADPRIVGFYALPPDGIRIQKNTKKTPDDKTGEPHDDGLISGGAQADLLVGLVMKLGVEEGLTAFGKMTLGALSVVPAHKVTFRDLLNAYLTADQQLNSGANKDLVTKSFGDHGIKLTGSRRRKTPVIIVI